MKKSDILIILACIVFFTGIAAISAADVVAPSAKGPQWQNWNPSKKEDLGSPVFKPVGSTTMTLYYGFRGAVVHDRGTNKWERLRMVTITRHKVEGFVNQVNDRLALAAGLHEVAVYDFSKHRWFVLEKVTPDDSTNALRQNIILTPGYARVKQLNGQFYKYTTATGWMKSH